MASGCNDKGIIKIGFMIIAHGTLGNNNLWGDPRSSLDISPEHSQDLMQNPISLAELAPTPPLSKKVSSSTA